MRLVGVNNLHFDCFLMWLDGHDYLCQEIYYSLFSSTTPSRGGEGVAAARRKTHANPSAHNGSVFYDALKRNLGHLLY